MQVYQRFDVDVPPAYNFTKKWDSSTGAFLRILGVF